MSKIRSSLCTSLLAALLLSPALAPSAWAAASARKPAAKPAAAPVAAKPEGTPATGGTRCGEDDAQPTSAGKGTSSAAGSGSGFEATNVDPRGQVQMLVQQALQRSKSLGAATLLAQAARDDWEEARAARRPTVSGNSAVFGAEQWTAGYPVLKGQLSQLSLSASAPIYDAGRTELLANWRAQLAEAARQGMIDTEQQLALQTVALAMDRSRYNLQIQVYGQYVRKMACLVEALQTIVDADRGRASELVQAQKNRQQAELSVQQTVSALRQTEVRLRRFVGDDLPPSAGYSALLTQVPVLAEMQADVSQAAQVVALDAQAQAQSRYADATATNNKPTVSWLVSGSRSAGISKTGEVQAGVTVNIPIYTPGYQNSVAAARNRANAARLQLDDAIESRIYRMADIHEAATSSFERARSIVDILRSSDRLRAATLLQWQQLGRRSLFDVMGAEGDYYGLRIAHINAIYDGEQAVAMLWSLGRGVMAPLR